MRREGDAQNVSCQSGKEADSRIGNHRFFLLIGSVRSKEERKEEEEGTKRKKAGEKEEEEDTKRKEAGRRQSDRHHRVFLALPARCLWGCGLAERERKKRGRGAGTFS